MRIPEPSETSVPSLRSRRGARAVAAPGALALLALATLVSACGGGGPAGPPPGAGAVAVAVGKVVREPVPVEVHAVGNVVARSTVSLTAQVGGQVTAVHFKEGDDVRRGQLLVSIDPASYRAALEQAEANLERDRVLAANAGQDVERYADLVKKDYVTQEEYDQIRTDAESKKAAVAADRAAVDNARLDLDRATLEAPITGRTGQLLIHPGNLVKANDKPLVVIQQMEPIDVLFSVPERYLPEVRHRTAAGTLEVVATPSGDASPHRGTLSFIDNTVDPATGTIQLKATFPNQDRALWPGQFLDVAVKLAVEQDALVAPAPAIQTGQKGDYVFVVKPDMTVESRPVEVSRTIGGKAVVTRGLEAGMTVVTDGQLRLVPGAKVEVKKSPDETAPAPSGAAGAAPQEASS